MKILILILVRMLCLLLAAAAADELGEWALAVEWDRHLHAHALRRPRSLLLLSALAPLVQLPPTTSRVAVGHNSQSQHPGPHPSCGRGSPLPDKRHTPVAPFPPPSSTTPGHLATICTASILWVETSAIIIIIIILALPFRPPSILLISSATRSASSTW